MTGYLGWRLLRRFPPFHYFPNFSASSKYMLATEYHVHTWQMLPQLSCSDTCQIWIWCKESSRYFDRLENCVYRKINEQSFSNPHLRIVAMATAAGQHPPLDKKMVEWSDSPDISHTLLCRGLFLFSLTVCSTFWRTLCGGLGLQGTGCRSAWKGVRACAEGIGTENSL